MSRMEVFNKGDIVYVLDLTLRMRIVDGNYFDEPVLCLIPLNNSYANLAGWYLMRDCRHI